ncbi:hypothetical protein RM844_16980 [Streptomyces sp. DSM 44915]|uniref:Tape measure protein n=1 Tax=Streptomyces chisholmiae TaxID=3075540 RepID=A0ABU2JSL5_9ACTN|nr:hypothetical protein [Streptomyces sp. DSM 44915]MDT0267976.1 hypothetical protein [Streptomyces sp. DSM 44915]
MSESLSTELTRLERRTNAVRIPARLVVDRGEITRLRAELAGIRPLSIPARVDVDRSGLDGLRSSLGSLVGSGGGAARGLGSLLGSVGGLTSLASAVPAVSALVASLAQMAPAAGLAAPALLAVGTAGAAVAIGTRGVSDALAGDAEALARLTPAAREFVQETRALAPAWRNVQSAVQERLFTRLGETLSRTASSVLPVLRTQLSESAGSLNLMARQVLNAATGLSESGALGQALDGANAGLRNLISLPAVLVQGLVQIGAAAAPAFERMTAAAGRGLESLSQRMANAFADGRMQAAIERAVSLVRSLFSTLGNIGSTLGNIFGPAAEAGAGFLPILSQIAETAARVTASPEAQATFQNLFSTLSAVAGVIGGTLSAALQATFPLLSIIVNTLSGPIQNLASTLGPILQNLAAQLGSALEPAVSAAASALALVLPIVGQLAGQLAGELGPVLLATGTQVGRVASVLTSALQPVLENLPSVIGPLISTWAQLQIFTTQLAGELLTALTPSLISVGESAGELMVALGPLIEALGVLLVEALNAIEPAVTPTIAIVGRLAEILTSLLASQITNIVVPAIELITSLLQGDFRGAVDAARSLLSGLLTHFGNIFSGIVSVASDGASSVIGWFADMGAGALENVRSMGANILASASSAMASMGSAISRGVSLAGRIVGLLPGLARAALGNIGSFLYESGKALIQGFIDGIQDMAGAAADAARSLLSGVRNLLPFSPAKEGPFSGRGWTLYSGRAISSSLADGILDGRRQVRDATMSVARTARFTLDGPTSDIPRWVGGSALMLRERPPNSGLGAISPNRGAAVQIENFNAGGLTPQEVARELEWQMRSRG